MPILNLFTWMKTTTKLTNVDPNVVRNPEQDFRTCISRRQIQNNIIQNRVMTPNPHQGLNAAIYDQPDAGPALPGRPMSNQYQNVNQATTKPTTTPAYLELIDVDEENHGTGEC